ncbi:MAG: peptidoglycan recognition family protein [Vicinamibacterales bacterium]|nr:peptidoglycan recognition family protein [Vicinamibacterales bacterium]
MTTMLKEGSPGEVPRSIWVPADPSRYRPRPQAQQIAGYSMVVIHGTSGRADPMGPANMWKKPGVTSAHFVIGQNGTIIQCVPLRFAAQHAHSASAYSVGVEHCMREPGEFAASDPGLPPSDVLYKSSGWLTAYLLKAAGLQVNRQNVKGHAEADSKTTHTGCPDACGWNWERYMIIVEDEYAALSQETT